MKALLDIMVRLGIIHKNYWGDVTLTIQNGCRITAIKKGETMDPKVLPP